MPFATVAVPFSAYRDLPTPQHRWLLLCLARYADRAGVCWPSIRQLAADSRMSPATVCRYLKSMDVLGVFHRERQGVGRYRYTLAEAYVPRWKPRVSSAETRVPHGGKQKAKSKKPNHKKDGSRQWRNDRAGYGAANHRDQENTFVYHNESSLWDARLSAWRRSGGKFWPAFAGPRPDEPGCQAPHEMLSRAGHGSTTLRQ